jgi:hypothetical protein
MRDTDITGRPSSRPRIGEVELEIESTNDIFFWTKIALDNHEGISGKITFKKRDEEVKMKELFFEGAFVVRHSEEFHAGGGNPMSIRFTLSAELLRLESNEASCEVQNEWPPRSR